MDRPHKQLRVWQESMALAESVYAITARFPIHERFGLIAQMRRAAVSIPSNIAEGVARFTTKDYLHFLVMARGSHSELDTQLELSRRLGYLSEQAAVFGHLDKTGKLLTGLINSLRNKLGTRGVESGG